MTTTKPDTWTTPLSSTWLAPVDLATESTLQEILADAEGVWALTIVDGVQTKPGDRILVKNEPTGVPFQNGIYEVQANGDWVFSDEAEPGDASTLVIGGDTNQSFVFTLDENGDWLRLEGLKEALNEYADADADATIKMWAEIQRRRENNNGWNDDPLSMDRL